ncbi:MAG TPA: DUF3352 domain-containing protein, partial [Actinomycetota bacterium]|nr:DUF3352 domain-containing protein [Actinomycetota bacterium]
GSGIIALSLQAQSQGIVLSGHSSLPASAAGAKGGTFKILPTTPDDLLGSVSFFDLGDLVGNVLKTLDRGLSLQPAALGAPQVPGLSSAAAALQEIQRALGLNLQKDLLPWLKGELSIVVGPVTHPPIPDIGILIQPTDQAALGRTMKALKTHLAALLGSKGKVHADASGLTITTSLGPEIVVRTTSDRVVIATAQYAQRLLNPSGATLANDTVYMAAIDPSKPTVFQLFVRLDRVRTLVEGFLKLSDPSGYANYERNVQPSLTPLQALAIQTTVSGNSQDFRLVLTIAKP